MPTGYNQSCRDGGAVTYGKVRREWRMAKSGRAAHSSELGHQLTEMSGHRVREQKMSRSVLEYL